MHHFVGRLALGAISLAVGLATAALAQDAPVRVRGTIETVEGNMLAVKSRDGAELKVRLADNATVAAVVKAALADIKPGTFVGAAALPQTDGSWKAIEVLIFPEAMRGSGEGDRAWDLQPKSTMTNATVATAVSKVEGHTLTLTYKGGEKTIVVPPEAPIVTFAAGERSELKPGSKIFIGTATRQADGTLEAARVTVGRDTPPPM
jgi:hypothetical protein